MKKYIPKSLKRWGGSIIRWYLKKKWELKDYIRSHKKDSDMGVNTIGLIYDNDDLLDYTDAQSCMPATYNWLEIIFNQLPINPNDTFIDIGSGMGRVVFYVNFKYNIKSIGIELRVKAYKRALASLSSYKKNKANIFFLNKNILDYKFTDETLFYLYNPFGISTMMDVIENIKISLIENPRNIRIVYIAGSDKHKTQNYLDSIPWLSTHNIDSDNSIQAFLYTNNSSILL